MKLNQFLDGSPRAAALLERPGVTYLGPCIVQAPGAWCRVGPTWHVPGVGWLVVGPEAAEWGTTRGLAELATNPDISTKWHAAAMCVAPAPNVVLAVALEALKSGNLAEVRALADEADRET